MSALVPKESGFRWFCGESSPDHRIVQAPGQVLETLLVIDSAVIDRDAHLERMSWSLLRLFDRPMPVDLPQRIAAAARGLQGRHRMRVTAVSQPRGVGVAVTTAPTPPIQPGGVRLTPALRWHGLGNHKWPERWAEWRASLPILRQDLVLVCDASAGSLRIQDDPFVLETEMANIVAVIDGVLVSPPDSARLLPGVTLRRVLALAKDLGIPVRRSRLRLNHLMEADEVFMTSSIGGIKFVAQIGPRPNARIGGGRGPVTMRLQKALWKFWDSEAARARSKAAGQP